MSSSPQALPTVSKDFQHDELKVAPGPTQQDKPAHNHDVGEGAAASDGETKTTSERSKPRIMVIMFALMLSVFLAALDVTIIATALPTISSDLQSATGYTWIGAAFLLSNAASIPLWGKISDIFGRKPILLLANILFMVGSLVAALSNSTSMLVAARAIQGIGGGGLIILANIVIADLFPLRVRSTYYGLIGATLAFAGAIGPLVGGAFTQNVTWRWCFYVNLPLGGLAFFTLLFFLNVQTPRTPVLEGLKAIDWVGSLLIVSATLLFLLGLEYGGITFPWGSATVNCLIIFGVFTLGLFVIWEAKFASYPVLPISIFSNRSNAATLAVVFCHGFAFIAGTYYLPLYFQAIRGASPIYSGIYTLPSAISVAVASILAGIYIGKTGLFFPPIYLSLAMMTLGYGLFIDLGANSSWAKMILYQIIHALGVGPLFQAPTIALQAHIHLRDIATGTSSLAAVRQLAAGISIVAGRVVYQNELQKRQASLVEVLGPQLAADLGGGEVAAHAPAIRTLPQQQQDFFKNTFSESLRYMWVMNTVVIAAGLIMSLGIKRKTLSSDHVETETGLDAEKKYATQRADEKEARRARKHPGSSLQSSKLATSKQETTSPGL